MILTDLQMPIMDGLELVKRVREIERCASSDLGSEPSKVQECEAGSSCINRDKMKSSYLTRSPAPHRHIIIGMSANSDDETRKEALLAGMDSFIAKPFNVARFCDVLASVRASADDAALANT